MNVIAKHNDIRFSVISEGDVSNELDLAIRKTLVACFPADRKYFANYSWWHCVPIYRILGSDNEGSIVAHVAVVERTVIVGRNSSNVRVAGVQSFCLLPEYRSTGQSDKMMSIAMEQAQRRHCDAGLLFCLDKRQATYARMGWHKLDAVAYMSNEKDEKELIPAKNITMFYPLGIKQFPAGDIDLAGTDW